MSALAESMNEVTQLRTKHRDYGEWADEGERDDEYYEEDELGEWYCNETGYPDAAGVGTIDYDA